MTGHEHMEAAEGLVLAADAARRGGSFDVAAVLAMQAKTHALLAQTAATVDLLAARGIR